MLGVMEHLILIIYIVISTHDFSIKIFTRWGKKVFEDDKVNFKWDGKMKNSEPCSDGVYFYNIESPLPVAPKKGTISIIR